jgi:hypothetical protein
MEWIGITRPVPVPEIQPSTVANPTEPRYGWNDPEMCALSDEELATNIRQRIQAAGAISLPCEVVSPNTEN